MKRSTRLQWRDETMWRPRFVAVGVCLWVTVLLTTPGDGLAQGVPGYRMRFPMGNPIGGPVGASVRPPRLTGTTDSPLNPPGGSFRRRSFITYWPFGYYVGSDGYAYPDDSTGDAYSPETPPPATQPASDVYPVYDTVPDVGPLEVSSRHIASKIVVRLTWRDHGLAATQVAFFLADTTRAVLTAQTVRSPPFTAQFEPPSGTAFAGMTVVLPGGNLVTRFVPYRRRAP
jgi:hypothetical protein